MGHRAEMGSKATQYLEWHGQQWRVRVKVPARLRVLLGKGKLTQPLHTADLKEANQRKWPIVAQIKGRIAAAEKVLISNDPDTAVALELRLTKDDEQTNFTMHLAAEQLEERAGRKKALAFAALATGKFTPLDHHTDAFVTHQGYRQKTAGDFRRALGWLGAWLKDADQPLALEHVSRHVAGRFIAESLVVGRSADKASAYLTFLRQYWRWLREKGHLQIESNPWVEQSLPSAPRAPRSAEEDKGKRPFTDDELKALLAGDGGPLLNDLMPVAALSGMRLEEICQLQVADCQNGVFSVWAGKTDNAKRTVPIHTGLTALVERRTQGKVPTAYLFDELPPVPKSRETRPDPAAKRFTRYRRKQGVDERPNGKAKSNVEFHSFRRWFVRKAREAKLAGATGFDEWTLVWVVGHTYSDRPKSLDLSQRGYAGPDAEKAKKDLVEAVKLPVTKKGRGSRP